MWYVVAAILGCLFVLGISIAVSLGYIFPVRRLDHLDTNRIRVLLEGAGKERRWVYVNTKQWPAKVEE